MGEHAEPDLDGGTRDRAELDLGGDVVDLTAALVDVPSESGAEEHLADMVERALRRCSHLNVVRSRNNIVARVAGSGSDTVLLGGHLDTVPSSGNLPHRRADGVIHGLGSCDMKGGVAVALRLAATIERPVRNVTYVFYECEEVDATRNGLRHLAAERPDLLRADFAILMEPSNAAVEAGCQGTVRAVVGVDGRRAHSARSWMGSNAVHAAADVLEVLRRYRPRRVRIDGLEYREGLSAVGISGGVAGNVIPDRCLVTVNYRFAPNRTVAEAKTHVLDLFGDYDVTFEDESPGALPGLTRPAARAFLDGVGSSVEPKFGWTDVARFAELGVPAVNYGPGDPSLAHAPDELVPERDLRRCESALRRWLVAPGRDQGGLGSTLSG